MAHVRPQKGCATTLAAGRQMGLAMMAVSAPPSQSAISVQTVQIVAFDTPNRIKRIA